MKIDFLLSAKKGYSKCVAFIKRKPLFLLYILLAVFIFTRFYGVFERANFGWDQVDSAWAAKSILVDKHIFINGPVAKGNSGIYMGPLYYYLITPFYFFTNLDPIASPIFQGVMSIVSILILFFVTKKLFNTQVAYIATFISTFSIVSMSFDKTQSDFYLIVPISYLIFFALYNIVKGKEKFIFLLAIFLGISFHVDFTSVFYPIIILLTLPFFPKNRKTLLYIAASLPIFLIFLLPSLLLEFSGKHTAAGNLATLFHTSYHGIHLRRLLQLISDAFISFGEVLEFSILSYGQYLVLPLFLFVYYKKYPTKQSLLFFYLIFLWICIPWIVLSAYSGELTNYYFSLPRDLVVVMLAYLLYFLYQQKGLFIKLIPTILLGIYTVYGIVYFWTIPNGNLLGYETDVKQIVKEKKYIPFKDHKADSYLYYVYTRKK